MSEYNAEQWIIKQGLDDENFYVLWPASEWLMTLAVMGLVMCFHHVLAGFALGFLMMFLFLKFRNKEQQRGSKTHYLWRLGLLKSKKGLQWAPPATVTRFDN